MSCGRRLGCFSLAAGCTYSRGDVDRRVRGCWCTSLCCRGGSARLHCQRDHIPPRRHALRRHRASLPVVRTAAGLIQPSSRMRVPPQRRCCRVALRHAVFGARGAAVWSSPPSCLLALPPQPPTSTRGRRETPEPGARARTVGRAIGSRAKSGGDWRWGLPAASCERQHSATVGSRTA